MKWEKIVKDAAINTLAAVVGLFLFMFLTLSLFFPSTMMQITYDLGMEKSSMSFAKSAYKATKDAYYIDFAMKRAIVLDDEKEIILCGEKFIKNEDFKEYCDKQDEKMKDEVLTPYNQYVYGQVCSAKYEIGKKSEAIDNAFAYTVGFPRNNAVVVVTVFALKKGDTATKDKIKEKMKEIELQSLSDTEKAYYEQILGLIG